VIHHMKFTQIYARDHRNGNPHPCGFYGDLKRECRCPVRQIENYRQKISGPLLDRIDLHCGGASGGFQGTFQRSHRRKIRCHPRTRAGRKANPVGAFQESLKHYQCSHGLQDDVTMLSEKASVLSLVVFMGRPSLRLLRFASANPDLMRSGSRGIRLSYR